MHQRYPVISSSILVCSVSQYSSNQIFAIDYLSQIAHISFSFILLNVVNVRIQSQVRYLKLFKFDLQHLNCDGWNLFYGPRLEFFSTFL